MSALFSHTNTTNKVVVGEKGNDPNLYVFEYPSWRVVKVLKKGAERGYSCLAFSPDGNKLASVAMVLVFTHMHMTERL